MAQSASVIPAVAGAHWRNEHRHFPGLAGRTGQHGRPRAGRIHPVSDWPGRGGRHHREDPPRTLCVAPGSLGPAGRPRGWRAIDLCLRCAEPRLVDAGPGLEVAPLRRAPAGSVRLGRTWPVPASTAPVAPSGRAGRHPDPRAALPAGTGGARHGPVCCGPRRHQLGLPPRQTPGQPQRPGQVGAGPGHSPGRLAAGGSRQHRLPPGGAARAQACPDPRGGEVDFLVEDCLIVETDGESHLEPRQAKKDRGRNNASMVGGYLVLRFGYDLVVYHPEQMLAQVLAVLEQRRRGAFNP